MTSGPASAQEAEERQYAEVTSQWRGTKRTRVGAPFMSKKKRKTAL